MTVEGSSTPEWRDRQGKLPVGKGSHDRLARWIMEFAREIPRDHLSEALSQVGEPIAQILVQRTIAQEQHSVRGNAVCEMLQEISLFPWLQIMQQIEEQNRALAGKRLTCILPNEFNILIIGPDFLRSRDLAGITIDSQNRPSNAALAQIEREQSDAAPEVNDRVARVA